MATENSLLENLVQIAVPQPCYDEYFIKFNLFDVVCFKLVLSKCLGLAIIAGSLMVKVPQIVKIKQAKSGEGISMLSITLELAAISATFAYSYAKNFPFSAYGEAVFILIQSSIIACLVMYYTDRAALGVFYMGTMAALLALMVSPLVPDEMLWYIQASVLPNVVTARMIQAFTNLKNGSTGQLSVVTFSLLFAGALARVFTSIQETGDMTVVVIYVVSAACNGVILSQILYYGSGRKQKAE